MSMLGAQLDDLSQLSTRLVTTAGDIDGTNTRCTSATTQVVDSLKTSATTALRAVEAEMQALRSTVDAAQSSTDGAMWTGGNSDRFRSAYTEFNGAMAQAESTTRETFGEFNQYIEQMTAQLEEYVSTFSAALVRANEATNSMSQAVNAQQDALDQVMNAGLTIG
jgi:hypothetical protein